MDCEIITTGSELLNGSTMDTNSFYIMAGLYRLGIDVNYNISVPDNDRIMVDTFERSIERSDLIYIVGGLGPTEDDKTKALVLKAIDNISHEGEEAIVDDIANPLGTALGVYIRFRNKKILLFPGPPREMEPMFDNTIDLLANGDLKNYQLKTVNVIGLGESKIEPVLKDISKEVLTDSKIELLTYPKDRRVDVHIKYEDTEEDRLKLEEVLEVLNLKLGQYIYGYDCDSIEEVFMDLAKKKNIRLGLAESCTGGLVADKITNISGSSDVLVESLVTYSYESKARNLNIPLSLLEEKGAVNEEVARLMAKGVYENNEIDLALSVTGVAGPGPSDGQEEGCVFIGIKGREIDQVEEYKFKGGRKTIKNLAATQALINLIKIIKDY